MPLRKKKDKDGKFTSAANKTINDALKFDDKLTRRLPIQEATLNVTRGEKGEAKLGLQLGNHPLGTVVRGISRGGAAENCGLKCGDVIVTIDGLKITSCQEAAVQIKSTVLDTLEISYYKASDAEGLLLKKRKAPKLCAFDAAEAAHERAGMTLEEHPLGLLVAETIATDPAARAGIKKGDVIVTLAGRVVLSPDYATTIINQIATLGSPNVGASTICVTYLPAKAATLELVLINSSYVSASDVAFSFVTPRAPTTDVDPQASASQPVASPATAVAFELPGSAATDAEPPKLDEEDAQPLPRIDGSELLAALDELQVAGVELEVVGELAAAGATADAKEQTPAPTAVVDQFEPELAPVPTYELNSASGAGTNDAER